MRTVTFRISEEILEKLDVWADVFASSRGELIRNWIEDVLKFLHEGVLEMDRKRHLILKHVDKKTLKEIAEALYYVSENGDSKTFNLGKYEELSNKILEILEEK